MPNCIWASDIRRHVYLCVIIDLFSRKVVSWKFDFSIKSSLVCDTLRSAFIRRGKPENLIFHFDQGSQYTGHDFKNLLDELSITASFSKKG